MRQSFVVSVILFAAGCATGGGMKSTAGWSAVQSKHVTVYTTSPQGQEANLKTFERAYAAYSSAFFFKALDPGKVDALLLDDADFKALFGSRRTSVVMPRAPGGGTIGKTGLIVLKPEGPGAVTPLTAGELLSHHFVHKALPAAPLWLHEGFAKYARGHHYAEQDGKPVGCFGQTEDALKGFEELFTTSWEKYDAKDERLHYKISSHSLVDYLIHSSGTPSFTRLDAVVKALSAGKTSPEALAEAFPGVPLPELEDKVTHHLSRGSCPVAFPIEGDRLPDEGSPQILPASPADLRQLFEGLKKLPFEEDGYPPWYPPEIIARSEGAAAGTK